MILKESFSIDHIDRMKKKISFVGKTTSKGVLIATYKRV